MQVKWLWLSVLVIVLDQATKYMVVANFELYESKALLPFLNLTLLHNTGAAFSFLAAAGGWQRWLFLGLGAGASVMIVLWLMRLPRSDRRLALALALILGGALGNVWDRAVLGYVIDFIDVYYGNWHWPAFNVADSAITVGAALLLFDGLFGQRRR